MVRHYGGWKVYRCSGHPATGKFRAVRFGVWIGAGTEEQLIRMIDQRRADEYRERNERMKAI